MRNTIKNVTIVVPVLITSCHVSEKPKSGPKMSQTSTVAQANKRAGVLPVQQVAVRANDCVHDRFMEK